MEGKRTVFGLMSECHTDAVDKNHKPICQQFLCDLFDPFDPFWRIALNVSRYKSAIKYMKGSKGQKGQLIFLYMPCDSLVTNPSSSHEQHIALGRRGGLRELKNRQVSI